MVTFQSNYSYLPVPDLSLWRDDFRFFSAVWRARCKVDTDPGERFLTPRLIWRAEFSLYMVFRGQKGSFFGRFWPRFEWFHWGGYPPPLLIAFWNQLRVKIRMKVIVKMRSGTPFINCTPSLLEVEIVWKS